MSSLLLATKVHIPPQPPHLVSRARLLDALTDGLLHVKVLLLAAPAGYGKSTLLAQWAHSNALPVAWLALDAEDNDRERFLRYLFTAWETIQPEIRQSRAGLLLGSQSPDLESVLVALINAANEIRDHRVLILDDYHLIQEEAIHQDMAFLLDHLPATLHFVLAARGEPQLPVARYRARGQLLDLPTEELAFQPDETAAFLHHAMGLDLPAKQIEYLQDQLEGWIAGLQLAALTLQRPAQARSAHTEQSDETEAPTISGRHRYIADYLSQDVLARLPADLHRFLLQTSILDYLCGDLCDAVTGQSGSQDRLEWLARENLFLIPLDDQRGWYRYHRLFADFLQSELGRHTTPGPGSQALPLARASLLHSRAARWYLEQDQPDPAFRHAVAGEDLPQVIEILDGYTNAKLMGGEFTLLQRWLDALPAVWIRDYPAFGLARGGLLAYSGAFEACLRCIDEVEAKLTPPQSENARRQLARVTAVRCFMACNMHDLPQAEHFAAQALHELPESDLGLRPVIYAALGDSYRDHARWTDARTNYEKALEYGHAPVIRIQAAHVFGALADLELRQGHLQHAADCWRQALAHVQSRENWGRVPLPVTGWIYIRMGELHYEWNELETAWDYLARGQEYAEAGGDVRARIAGYVCAARLQLAQGDVESAAASLARAQPLVTQAAFSDWAARFQRCQVELWLVQDRLQDALRWVADQELDRATEAAAQAATAPDPTGVHLGMAHVLIVQGAIQNDASCLQQAHAILEPLLKSAQDEGRRGVIIEGLALRALAYWGQENGRAALACLEPALRLAEPQGYRRLFLDLGLPLARLLQEAQARDVMPTYVGALLDAFDAGMTIPGPRGATWPGALPEPLTAREQEVLELMAAGLTNREIGEALVISPETVKKHAGNLYGKLATTNRTEAVAKARALHLLA